MRSKKNNPPKGEIMGTTDNVKKIRAAKAAPVKTGEWHADFSTVKKYADSKKIPLLAVWSNGDACQNCINFEKCILDSTFKTWAKKSGVAMWIGFGDDTSKEDKFEGTGFHFARKDELKHYPFFRLYWKQGKVDIAKRGKDWTDGTAKGAATLVKNLKNALKGYCPDCEPAPAPTPAPTPEPTPAPSEDFTVRLNEKLTVAQVNKVLDAIDQNDGYCPCQPKSEDSKCSCKDFRETKKIGEPCICNIFVKQPKAIAKATKRAAKPMLKAKAKASKTTTKKAKGKK